MVGVFIAGGKVGTAHTYGSQLKLGVGHVGTLEHEEGGQGNNERRQFGGDNQVTVDQANHGGKCHGNQNR